MPSCIHRNKLVFPERLSTTPLIIALLLLLSACGGLKLDPPGPDRQAILVFPVEWINEAQTSDHGFYYIYEISKAGEPGVIHEAVIKLPIKGDMLLVDSLPPGKYAVTAFRFKTIGPGDFTYGQDVEVRNDPVTLEVGKITIFSHSLNVLTYHRIPGRGAETIYRFDVVRITSEQRAKALATLSELPNFESWTVANP